MPVRLSGKDIVKALGKGGWDLERITRSHHIMRHADGRHVSIPVHGARPLPAGTLAAICRQVGRTASELRNFFRATEQPVSLSFARWNIDAFTDKPMTWKNSAGRRFRAPRCGGGVNVRPAQIGQIWLVSVLTVVALLVGVAHAEYRSVLSGWVCSESGAVRR
jgi:predicted RNA binding protein YcfA (HicA-like mRNA interferase family)